MAQSVAQAWRLPRFMPDMRCGVKKERAQVSENDFSTVQALMGFSNPLLARGVHEAFRQAGFTKLEQAATAEQLKAKLAESVFDLLVLTTGLEEAFVAPLVAQLRNGQLGQSPFAVVIMLVTEAQQDYVRKVIDCGPDDMLLLPVAPTQLLSRVEALVQVRRPFVVTHDFTGPDRRKDSRSGGRQLPLIDVPNPLAVKATGGSVERLNSESKAALRVINAQKLDRYMVQIQWLSDTIAAGFRDAGAAIPPAKMRGISMRLQLIADDVPWRLGGHVEGALQTLLGALGAQAKAILASGSEVERRQIETLGTICARLAKEISRQLPSRHPAGAVSS